MKLVYQCTFLCFLFLLNSCKGQEVEPAKATPVEPVQEKEVPDDFDPYFTESTATSQAPKSIVRNILQDKDGDMWFATWEGIFRYDGKDFVNLTNQDALRRHRAFSIMEDSKGNIWVGTMGAGVYHYDKRAYQSSWTNFTSEEGLLDDDIGWMFEDSKGNVWFGTLLGVSCYDGESFINFTKEEGLIDGDINGIIEDQFGRIWFAARGEACMYDGESFTKITTETGMSFTNARSILLDSRGNIWLGGKDGLWRFDGKNFKNFTSSFVGNIYEDSKGNIWVSQSEPDNIYSMSLYTYGVHDLLADRTISKQVTKSGRGQIFGITEDREGNIWFGLEGGVCRYNGLDFEYFK